MDLFGLVESLKNGFKSLWNFLWESYDKLVGVLWSIVNSVLQWFSDWYSYIVDCLYSWFWDFFWWCEGSFLDLMEWAIDCIPFSFDFLSPYFGSVAILFDYVSKANLIFPVSEILILLAFFLPALFYYIFVRLVLRIAPWVA